MLIVKVGSLERHKKRGGTYDINRVGFVCKNQIFKGRGDDGEAISVLKQTRKLTGTL